VACRRPVPPISARATIPRDGRAVFPRPDLRPCGSTRAGRSARRAAGDGGRQPDAGQLLRRRQPAAAGARGPERRMAVRRCLGLVQEGATSSISAASRRGREPSRCAGHRAAARAAGAPAPAGRTRSSRSADQHRHAPCRCRRALRWLRARRSSTTSAVSPIRRWPRSPPRPAPAWCSGTCAANRRRCSMASPSRTSSPRSPRSWSRPSSARCGPVSPGRAHRRRSGHRLRQDRRAERRARRRGS
jgi:hypothetical protein